MPTHDVTAKDIARETFASASSNVQLVLAHVPGPVHLVKGTPLLRVCFNIGPSFSAEKLGEGQSSFFLRRHGLLLIPANTETVQRSSTPRPVGRAVKAAHLATFRISNDLVAAAALRCGMKNSDVLRRHHTLAPEEVLRGLAQTLLVDLKSGCPDGGQATDALAMALVERLFLRLASEKSDPLLTAVQRVTNFIQGNISGELSLAVLADVAGMSTFHFSRVFKLQMGTTPHEFVLRQRVEAAKRLLWVDSAASVLNIALACGFSSSSHFSSQFLRRTGHTPLQWRKGIGERPSPDIHK